MKTKSLADFIDKKSKELLEPFPGEYLTLAQENLVCPLCGWKHDPDDLSLRKQQHGLVKCSDCGEAFEFEAVRKTVYSTSIP
jgi:hypothetical protein